MFAEVMRFELRYRLRQPLVYLLAIVFFLMTFGAVSTDSIQLGGAIGKVARNSPLVITTWLTMMSALGLLVITAFVATAVNRDDDLRTREMFCSTPLRKAPYLLGRLTSSMILSVLVVAASGAGILAGSLMPYQDPEYIVPFRLAPYLYAMGIMVLPNLFLTGAIFFSIATLTRKILFTYVSVVAFFALWGISKAFLGDLENQSLAALLDPFGITPLKLLSRYWTVAEQNTALVPLSGGLLLNRILWTGVGGALLVFTLGRFRMGVGERRGRSPRRTPPVEAAPTTIRQAAPIAAATAIPKVSPRFSFRAHLSQWWYQTRIEVREVLLGIPFLVLLIFGIGNLLGVLIANVEGTNSYPVTRLMLRMIAGSFDLMVMLILVVYAATLIWKERHARMNEICDALPVPDWVPVLAKLTTLAVVSVVTLACAMLTTMAFQATRGYFHFELGLYLRGLFLVALAFWLFVSVISFFAHVLANNKWIGFLLVVIYLVLLDVFPAIGLSHHLYLLGTTPSVVYSDMNGYRPFVQPLLWFNLYWGALALGMVVLSRLLWVRGTDQTLRNRLRAARARFTRPHAAALAAGAAVFLLLGGWIYYNTNILNAYESEDASHRLRAVYEQRYKQYESLPQPHVTNAKFEVDLFPEERRADMRGTLRLVNKTDATIERLHLLLNKDLVINTISLPQAAIETDDREVGYRVYRLDSPLAPGEDMDLHFDFSDAQRGFKNHDYNTSVVANGTFFHNTYFAPHIGYSRQEELDDPKERKKFDLPPRERMPAVDDLAARGNMAFCDDSDWITFETTISTSLDQVALAPGYVTREWTKDGRRYFHYTMQAAVPNLYAFLSGRYEVARDVWNDVAISVYYHEDHGYNVGRMIDAIKKSLDYYSTNFSPYQHRQVRIIEFPCYATFAQSLPNTIPYSESAHFINDLRDEDNIDMVFYITAHEVAHQWWGHQVIGSEVQGSTLIIEAMAQYSALMVMEKEYGRDQMKKFLAYELHRYLRGRGRERIEEKPLLLVENQPYIHYYKGSLAMYALRAYIGEAELNSALRRFIRDKAFQEPPYTNSLEFLAYIREVTPERFSYLIEDLFETITLYDNRAEDAVCTRTDDGRYRVRLAYQSHKMRVDGLGTETAIDHQDWIEIGVFGEEEVEGGVEETTLYLEKRRLSAGSAEIEIVVDDKPVRAGIDPRNLLIDRVPDDNVKGVSG